MWAYYNLNFVEKKYTKAKNVDKNAANLLQNVTLVTFLIIFVQAFALFCALEC